MSDGDSVAKAVTDNVTELGKGFFGEIADSAKNAVKSAGQQIIGIDSEEIERQRKEDKLKTFRSIKAIEAEMAEISANKARRETPQTVNQTESAKIQTNKTRPQTPDEASRQAIGRAEQGRNFKG